MVNEGAKDYGAAVRRVLRGGLSGDQPPAQPPQEPPAGPAKREVELPKPIRAIYIEGFSGYLTATEDSLIVEHPTKKSEVLDGESLKVGTGGEYKVRTRDDGVYLKLWSGNQYDEDKQTFTLRPGGTLALNKPGLTPEEGFGHNPVVIIGSSQEGDVQLVNREHVDVFKNGEKLDDLVFNLEDSDIIQVEGEIFEFERFPDDSSQLKPLKTALPNYIEIKKGKTVRVKHPMDFSDSKLSVYEEQFGAEQPDLGDTQPSSPTVDTLVAGEDGMEDFQGDEGRELSEEKSWNRSLKEFFKTTFKGGTKEVTTLTAATIADFVPEMGWLAMLVNVGAMTGGEILSGARRARRMINLKQEVAKGRTLEEILPENVLGQYGFKFTEAEIRDTGWLKLTWLSRVQESTHYKFFQEKNTQLNNAEITSAVMAGITLGAAGTLAMELIRVTPLGRIPGLSTLALRFGNRFVMQMLAPKALAEIGALLVKNVSGESKKGQDWYELALSTTVATTIAATSLRMISPQLTQGADWVRENLAGGVASTAAPEAAAAATATATLEATAPTQTPTPTETPTYTPTPDQVALLGWDPGEATNLDQVLETATDNGWVVNQGDSAYYYLDNQPGPDVIQTNEGITFVKNTDGNFWRDYNGDGILDQAVYTPEDIVPPNLENKNISGGHLQRPALNPEMVEPLPLTVDLDGDGKTEIIRVEDKYYFDLNNDNVVTDVDSQITNQPEVTHTETGYQIDKLELANGTVWSDLQVGFAGDGGSVMVAGSVNYADGSQWQYSLNPEDQTRPIITSKLAGGGALSLNSDINDTDLARYQYELARLHPEWTPDEVGKAAFLAQRDGVDVNALAGVTPPSRVPETATPTSKTSFWRYNQDGELVGIVNSTQVLRTDASGGWEGVIQGQAIHDLGDNIQNLMTPDTLGGIAVRARIAAGIEALPTTDSNFSSLSPTQQNAIHLTFNQDVMQFTLNNSLIGNLPDNVTYAQARDWVSEYVDQASIANSHFEAKVDLDAFEEWLRRVKHININLN